VIDGMGNDGARTTFIGRAIKRREDPRLLTGRGRYVGDIVRPSMVSAAVVRSPYAHARLRGIDTRRAKSRPGVIDCITFRDIKDGIPAIPIRMGPKPALLPYLQRPLAADRVRYVGEPVAVIVATDQYVAEDARELIDVEYEPLPAVVDATRAALPGSPALYPEGNLADSWRVEIGDIERALREAARVLRRGFTLHRHTGVPMETRGLVAEHDEGRGILTVWGVTKVPYFNRQVLAGMLSISEDQIHFVEPDVGGGFGVRGEFYPEDFLIPFLAMRLGRPVRWVEDRPEHFVSINHSREQRWTLAVAVDREGRLLGLDAALLNDHGAYIRTHGTLVPTVAAAHLPGPYRIPSYRCRVSSVMTNKTPTGTMRAPGLYECNFVRERALDMIAAELRIDPVELRRRNLVLREQMPYAVGTAIAGSPVVFDTGDFPSIFERALEIAGYWRLREESRKENASDADVRVGVGLACLVEPTGWGPYESAKAQVTPAGNIHVYTGATVLGQGLETTLAQVCAEVLRVPLDRIRVHHGDTALMPYGMGTYASRAAVMAGSAVHGASLKLRDRILKVAADHLEASPEDLVLEDGRVSVRGVPSRGCTLREVAALAGPAGKPGAHPGAGPDIDALEATHYHHATHETSSFGVHVAVVAVDVRTGFVTSRGYWLVCDVGRAINPLIVEGQLVGGVIHGLGGTFLEELVYDERGQLLTANFMDYLLPGAGECPDVKVTILEEAASPSNPLGVKGVGEAGTSGAGAALANAVADALGVGVELTTLPLSPHRVLAMLSKDAR
jgi:CO/xanthine dehydrogenase Mo-binding subunit